MNTKQVDIVVIGGGPAGYAAAIRAAQLKGKVALIEKEKLGGVCLNVGCIPTKTLLRSCEIFYLTQRAKEFGLEIPEVKINLSQLMARKNQLIRRLVGGVNYLLKKNNVEVIKGKGYLVDSLTVEVQGEEGEKIKAKNIIIANGSVSAALPLEGVDKEAILTSTEALQIEEIPENFLIIGAGAIGVEFANIYSILGSKVTIVEMMPHIIPQEDSELTEKLKESMIKRGIEIFTGSTLESVKKQGKNYIGLVKTPEGIKEVSFNKVLISIGRRPNPDDLGLEKVGIEKDEKGWIKVNSKMQTNLQNIYAAGDTIGGYQLAHTAYMEGEVAAENAMGKDSRINYRAVPRFVCSIPELAAVGLTEEKAKEEGHKVKIGKFPFMANGKALVYGEREGMVKIVCDAETEEILGIHILGPQATDLILEGTFAINLESTIQEIIETIHPHPTLGEAIREAALDVQKRAIHI